MKKKQALTLAAFLALCLLAACAGGNPASSAPAETPENTAAAEPAPSGESESDPAEEESPAVPAVALEFDQNAYRDPTDDDYYNALAYGSNSGERPVQVTFSCRAFDPDGNVMSVYDQFRDRRSEEFRTSVYIPAGAEKLPVAFRLPAGLTYDLSTGEEMPPVGHLEFEILETAEADTEDLRDHFTPGESEIRENHIYIYVRFDDEIGDNYTSLYPDYTLLGYSGGVLTTVSCRNDFPYGNSSSSVSYAKEHTDSSLLVYHHIPNEPTDKWELYLGCIAGQ